MESAIRWSPTSSAQEQRFLAVDVVGRSFKLCKVTSSNKSDLSYDVLSSHSRIPPFRAFDWSPVNEALVAVGQSSGEAAILRMDDGSLGPVVFPIRNQRYCNAVAFSTQNLLAAGLDKVRNDFCLNIWDVNQRLSASATRSFGGERHAVEPLRKLASSEPITSIKFFKDQPDTLVTGVKGQFVRIYDLREGTGNPSLQFPTRCVHNLAIDWLDENYIASCYPTGDSSICIWDRRSGSRYSSAAVAPSTSVDAGQLTPALEFKNAVDPKSMIWSLRFSRTKRGCLGMLSNAGKLKAYDIAKEYVSEEHRVSLDQTLGHDSARAYPEQIYTKRVRDFRNPAAPNVADDTRKVASFDYLNFDTTNEPSVVTLLANKAVSIFSLQKSPSSIDISSQGVLACGNTVHSDQSFKIAATHSDAKASEVTQSIYYHAASNGQTSNKSDQTAKQNFQVFSRDQREKLFATIAESMSLSAADALTWLSIPRLRCRDGYLLDSARNKSILSGEPDLQELWDWIGRCRARSSDESMVVNGVDMNYVGVYNVWDGRLGQSFESRMLNSAQSQDVDIGEHIYELVKELGVPDNKGCESGFVSRRQLCLRICGAAESIEELEATVKMLVEKREHTKAAALAIFQDETKLAYQALKQNEPTQAHKLLAMAIAGAAKGDTDSDWEETCAAIASELTDPYARAILALVSKSDWDSVLQETTLPLKYRVEVALRWLPDDQLSTYLQDTTLEAIRQGNVEGIVLTGLDHAAMDLFQSYISKFNDVQTAVLAMSHTVPRFINDIPNKARFEAWRETYRRQINSWKLHLDRAKFDVESRKLAATWDGRKLVKPPPQQVSLICNYCTKPLSQQDGTESPSYPAGPDVFHPTAGNPLGPTAMSGTVCPKCGRHMPRCGICSIWLGAPDPISRAAIAEEAAKGTSGQGHSDIMKRFVVFCINCNHGFHSNHAKEWFYKHRICPVAECNCICDR